MWYTQYIQKVPGVQGGEPVVTGTRTPVRAVVELFRDVYPGDWQELQRSLSHLTVTQLEAALAYYKDHQDEIDNHIERHRRALRSLQKT